MFDIDDFLRDRSVLLAHDWRPEELDTLAPLEIHALAILTVKPIRSPRDLRRMATQRTTPTSPSTTAPRPKARKAATLRSVLGFLAWWAREAVRERG